MKRAYLSIIFLFLSLSLAASEELAAIEVILLFGENLERLSDYQCRMYEWSVKGKKEEIRYINFYYRAPRLIRMDIIKGNRSGDTGSIGVLREDGKVRGRKGGILSPFAVTVDKNSALATTIRGVTFDESDALAAYSRLLFLIDNSAMALMEDERGWLFDCRLFEEDEGITREVLFIGKDDFMPLYTKSYENENLVQFVEWSSYIINKGLPVELFNVRYKAEKLNDLNIDNNIGLDLDLKYE